MSHGAQTVLDYRSIFETVPAALLVLSPDLTAIAVTDAYLAATGTRREDMLGRKLFDLFPDNPDEVGATGVSNLRRSLERVIRERVPDTMALQKYDIRTTVKGVTRFEERYWSPLNVPVLTGDGSLSCVIHRVEDVTEFVRIRQQQSAASKVADELKTRAGQMEAELIARAQTIQTSNRELRVLSSELEARVDARTLELQESNEKLQRSEAHLREVELRAAREALARERDVFNRFFQQSLDMMCIAGTDGRFRRVNPAFLGLGYSQEELLATPLVELVHPDDREATLANVRALAGGVPMVQLENRYRCKDGSYRWLSWNTTPDDTGTLYAVARDITENKRIEADLVRAQDAAETANRELESFSYTVAHDLRAPLRSIDGFSQALLEDYGGKLDAEGQGYLARLRGGAQRMARLIDDLLALSRLSRGTLVNEPVDLSELAREAVGRLHESAPDRQIEVSIEDGLQARGDVRLLTTALENLLGNAWKFTGQTESARIEFGATERDGQRAFFVRDNGAGFDMAYAHKLFGAFQRLHAVRDFEGTGIGLASVQRVVHRHGGRIWPEAAVGRGATFYFTLSSEELP